MPESDDNTPSEYKSALNKAKLYSDTMHMSKQGIYEQLTSEYGEKFSAEAGQYAFLPDIIIWILKVKSFKVSNGIIGFFLCEFFAVFGRKLVADCFRRHIHF